MSVLLSIDGEFFSTSTGHPGTGYDPITIGRPLAIELLTFFPGADIKEWGNKAELMITSQIRLGPSQDPAAKQINMLLRNYRFRDADPVQDYGGDVFGDPMLFYTKAFTGQRLGLTVTGVEMDKISPSLWTGIRTTLSNVGSLAFFTSAAPYLGAAGIGVKVAKLLAKGVMRNDRLQIGRADFRYASLDQPLLQSGRYVFWNHKKGPTSSAMRSKYKLTGTDYDTPNILVAKEDDTLYEDTPYFVVRIDAQKRPEYDDFELGSQSAELLAVWGDKTPSATIFEAIGDLAEQVNDASQLSSLSSLLKEFKRAGAEERKKLKAQIEARLKLFSDDNSEFVEGLMEGVLE